MQESNVLVSVIMPAYNCATYVNSSINSILRQSYSNFELLIADDASKDHTRKLIDAYSDDRIKCFHNNENQGYLVASNLLLEKALGKYIVFQDADDFSDERRIELLVSRLNKDEQLFAVGSNVVTITEQGEDISCSNFPLLHEEMYSDFSQYRNPIIGSALMFRREVLSTIGYYHLYFNRVGWEDYYWFSYIIQKYKVANVKEALYYYRSNPKSVSNLNKSVKSIAGFETIVYYMNQRKKNIADDISLNNIKGANLMMGRFYISNLMNEGHKISFHNILSISDNFLSAIKLYFFMRRYRGTLQSA